MDTDSTGSTIQSMQGGDSITRLGPEQDVPPGSKGVACSGPARPVDGSGALFETVGRWCCFLPLIHYLYVLLFWLLASGLLGEWARPGQNDPKGFLWGIPQLVHIVLLLLSFSVAPLVVLAGSLRGKVLRYLLIYVICLLGSVFLFRQDYGSITSWIAD